MSEQLLDLTSFEKALDRLKEGITRYEQDISDTQIRDGLIQRFEFTYEISHKMLKRYLEMASPTPEEFDGIAFQDLIRKGNEMELLLNDWSAWKKYREMRGKTSHTYDEKVALEVVEFIPRFFEEADFLCKKIHEKQQ